MKSALATVLLSLTIIVNAQQASPVRALNPAAESRAQEILRGLEGDNTLRLSLESGERGDGVHYGWMDKMRQYGIKQASFVISFKWKGGVESLKIKKVSFLRRYYRYDTQIKERTLLRQFREVGLERELRDVILIRAKASVSRMMKNVAQTANLNPRRHGTLYLNLLDDEALPILDEMPDVKG